jgi:hypothetical protein
MPKLVWRHEDAAGQLRVTVTADPAPLGARVWVAESPTRDFRKVEWKERPATLNGGKVTAEIAPPAQGFLAFFAELDFEIDGIRHPLSTQVRVAGKD